MQYLQKTVYAFGERYRNVFANARYPYKANSLKGYSDMLVYLLG